MMWIRWTMCALMSVAVLACGEHSFPEPVDSDQPEERVAPRVEAIDSQSLVVGEPLSFYGQGFVKPGEGTTTVIFEGTYKWIDGQGKEILEKISPLQVSPLYDGEFPAGGFLGEDELSDDTRVLRWNRFGPFSVPFTEAGNRPGTFKGQVYAINEYEDGTIIEGDPLQDVTLEVKPSILIRKLEPVLGLDAEGNLETAECGSPALRGIGGMAYTIEVEAIGFYPKYFIYELSGINGSTGQGDQWTSFTHQITEGTVDRLGDPTWPTWIEGELIVFDPLTEDVDRNIASIRITAVDENNESYYTALPLSVVRPVQFNYDGNREVAQYYEPLNVHGPIVGDIGTTVTYAETTSETRQNAVSVSISKNISQSLGTTQNDTWNNAVSESSTMSTTNSQGQSHTEGVSAQETYGASYSSSSSNNTNYSSTNGTQWGWNTNNGQSSEEYATKMKDIYGEISGSVTTEVSGEGSIPGFAKVGGKVGTTVGAKAGGKVGTTTGEKVGTNSSFGEHMYESDSESVAFGSTTTDSTSESIGGSYGLTSQSSINSSTSETEAATNSVTYSMGGNQGISENYTEGSQESWSETFVDSESFSTSFSMSSTVPHGHCAVVYRQTVRHIRRAQLYGYDLCGVRSLLGETYFNEWSWSAEIAVDDCKADEIASELHAPVCYSACE